MCKSTRRPQAPSKAKQAWNNDEDSLLLELVRQHGTANWSAVSDGLGYRSGKQCRERYHNHLDPSVRKGGWTRAEDELILRLQSKHGNAWAKITAHLPGRTDNAVKNRFWSAMRSKMRKNGAETKRHYPKEQQLHEQEHLEEESSADEQEDFEYDVADMSEELKLDAEAFPKAVTPTLRPQHSFDFSAQPLVIPSSQWSDPFGALLKYDMAGVGSVSPCSSSWSSSEGDDAFSDEDMAGLDDYCAAMLEGVEGDSFAGSLANFRFTPEGVFDGRA